MPREPMPRTPAASRFARATGAYPLCVAGLLLLTGCASDSGGTRAEPVRRDSAGVAIVEHPAELVAPAEWTITLDSAVRLAGEFSRVRYGVRFTDGRLAIADGDSRTLRVFAPDGTLQHVGGRDGAGPGEFRGITYMNRWLGDSVLVWDVQQRRLSVFDDTVAFVRSFALQTDSTTPFGNVQGVFADGSMYATGFSTFPGGGGPQPGRQRSDTPAYRFAADGRLDTTYSVMLSGEGFFRVFNDGGFSVMTPLFARLSTLHAGREILVHADNEQFDLRVYSPAGALQRSIRKLGTPAAITPSLRSAVVAHRLAELPSEADREREREALETMDVPATVPAFGRVLLDRDDRLWVEEFAAVPGDRSVWLVFTPEGTLVARATMPQRLTPLEIGRDYLLGVERDELDVESVVVIPLR